MKLGEIAMGAKNRVIAGDYEKKDLISVFGEVSIVTGWAKSVPLTKDTVEGYEIVDEEKRKSAASAVGRGLVGGIAGSLILGPVGLIGGLAGLSAKSKGVHILAIQFKDGKKSLLEVDDKIYKSLIKKLF
jgi:hypothetical protein